MDHAKGTQPTRVHTQARKYQVRGFHCFILLISSQRWDFLFTSSQKTPWGALLPLRSNPTLALPDTPVLFPCRLGTFTEGVLPHKGQTLLS